MKKAVLLAFSFLFLSPLAASAQVFQQEAFEATSTTATSTFNGPVNFKGPIDFFNGLVQAFPAEGAFGQNGDFFLGKDSTFLEIEPDINFIGLKNNVLQFGIDTSGKMYLSGSGGTAWFDLDSLGGNDRTFVYPAFSGTFGVLQADQTWSGINTFATSTGTTTVNFGEVGNTDSHSCFNTKNTDGEDISFYFVGTNIVVENNSCK